MLIDALPDDVDALRALVSQLSGERDAASDGLLSRTISFATY
jgi:hypothetical protein